MGDATIHKATTYGHLPVHCADSLSPAGKPVLLAELGWTDDGIPGIYLWCKVCRQAHHLSLKQMIDLLETFPKRKEECNAIMANFQ